MPDFKISGTITLDKKSEEDIKDIVRKEVLDKILVNKEISSDEIIQILNSYNWNTFYYILKEMMPSVMDAINRDEENNAIVFDTERKIANKLKLINQIFELM